MTTGKALAPQPAQSTSLQGSQREELPTALTEKQRIEGWTFPQWLTRPLKAGEVVDLQQVLLRLDQRLAPAPEGVTLALVVRLLNHWKDDRSQQEKEWRYEDWAEDLEEFSETHLRAALRYWRQNESFPPKSADIRKLCISERAMDQEHFRRCRVLLGLEQPRAWERPKLRHEPVEPKDHQRKLLAAVAGAVAQPKDQPEERKSHPKPVSEVMGGRDPNALAQLRALNTRNLK